MARHSRIQSAAMAILAIVLAQCAGLPKDLVLETERAGIRIEDESRQTENFEKQYEDFRKSPEYSAVEKYADREAWGQHFDAARAKVASADAIYKTDVVPAVEADVPKSAPAVRAALRKIIPLLSGARESARQWIERRDFLNEVAESADTMMAACESAVEAMKQLEPELIARAAKVKRDHAARVSDIDSLVLPLTDLRTSSDTLLASAAGEFKKRDSGGDFDRAVLGDSCRQAGRNSDEFLKGAPELSARLAQLDRSYSRTLIDMKTEHALVVRRESWDDSRDYPTIHNIDFRVANVDRTTFEYLLGIEGSLARYSRSMFGRRFSMLSGTDPQRWNALGIDPLLQWPGRDTHAEYWVQAAESRYFHRYLVQEDGATRESDWTEVSEDFFFANLENLGMDVESKPYGSFESEKLMHAAPPGMAYVGNPHYGRWTADGSGGSVWNWVGPYLFYSTIFGSPMRYGRSDWNTWSGGYRGSRPYYGGSSAAPRWGTSSQATRTSPKMQGSTFARGGGFRRPPSTVRGAGPSSRGSSFGASGK